MNNICNKTSVFSANLLTKCRQKTLVHHIKASQVYQYLLLNITANIVTEITSDTREKFNYVKPYIEYIGSRIE